MFARFVKAKLERQNKRECFVNGSQVDRVKSGVSVASDVQHHEGSSSCKDSRLAHLNLTSMTSVSIHELSEET